jgi:glucose-1-phosphate adenylyltransferase
MDLVAPHPVFNLYNDDWRVFTSFRTLPPAKIVAHGEYGSGDIANSMLSPGCIITGATVHDSVLSPNVRIEPGAVVEGSILFDDVHVAANAVVRNAIVDKHVVIPRGRQIGTDAARDAEEFVVSPGGIIAVGKGHKVAYA